MKLEVEYVTLDELKYKQKELISQDKLFIVCSEDEKREKEQEDELLN